MAGRRALSAREKLERLLNKNVDALWKKSGATKADNDLGSDDLDRLERLAKLQAVLDKTRPKGPAAPDESEDSEDDEELSPEELREAMRSVTGNHKVGGRG